MDASFSNQPAISDQRFCRAAGAVAPVVAAVGLVYSVAFVLNLRSGGRATATVAAASLLVGSLIATPVLMAVYVRLRVGGPGFALWVLLISVVAAVGSAIHGAYDLARLINPPDHGIGDLPNPVDPRGFLTFGLAGLGTVVLGTLILRSGLLPRRLGLLATVLGIALVVIYLGRLIILNPKNPLLLGTAAIAGLVLNPLWWIWLGNELRATKLAGPGDEAPAA
jgi:hypothetical protein